MWLLPKLYGGGLSFGSAWWYADGPSYVPMAWFLLANARLMLKILEIAVFLLIFKFSAFQKLIRKLLQKLFTNIIRTSWLKKWREKKSKTFYFRRALFCSRGTLGLSVLIVVTRALICIFVWVRLVKFFRTVCALVIGIRSCSLCWQIFNSLVKRRRVTAYLF